MLSLWPLIAFTFIMPLIVLFWVLLNKRKNKDQDIKNLDKQIESIRRFR